MNEPIQEISGKAVVYTTIFDDYDYLFEPKCTPDGLRFVCFTDDESLKSDNWDIVTVDQSGDLPEMRNRRYKFFPHKHFPEYTYSIYIDGNVQVTGDLTELVEQYMGDCDFAVPDHIDRNCLYDEGNAVIENGLAKSENVQQQLDRYREEGFPENYGLSVNRVIIRRHNSENVIKAMNLWWDEIQNETSRDQLSLSYVIWKTGLDYCLIHQDHAPYHNRLTKSNYFRLYPHKLPGFLGVPQKYWIKARKRKDESTVCKFIINMLSKFSRTIDNINLI
ncbi:glycosyltransferase domain-containing protein [Haloferax prahovense]|uniref:glycosyltransferase domain-containing protein n=1 Tax=Haloferax prahovense TaxID=381852 RepID=UPI003C752D35